MFDSLRLYLIRSAYVYFAPLMFTSLRLCLIGSAYVWLAPLMFDWLHLCLICSAYVYFAPFMFDSLRLCLIGSAYFLIRCVYVWLAPLMFDSLRLCLIGSQSGSFSNLHLREDPIEESCSKIDWIVRKGFVGICTTSRLNVPRLIGWSIRQVEGKPESSLTLTRASLCCSAWSRDVSPRQEATESEESFLKYLFLP
jgi:hypothetical protein